MRGHHALDGMGADLVGALGSQPAASAAATDAELALEEWMEAGGDGELRTMLTQSFRAVAWMAEHSSPSPSSTTKKKLHRSAGAKAAVHRGQSPPTTIIHRAWRRWMRLSQLTDSRALNVVLWLGLLGGAVIWSREEVAVFLALVRRLDSSARRGTRRSGNARSPPARLRVATTAAPASVSSTQSGTLRHRGSVPSSASSSGNAAPRVVHPRTSIQQATARLIASAASAATAALWSSAHLTTVAAAELRLIAGWLLSALVAPLQRCNERWRSWRPFQRRRERAPIPARTSAPARPRSTTEQEEGRQWVAMHRAMAAASRAASRPSAPVAAVAPPPPPPPTQMPTPPPPPAAVHVVAAAAPATVECRICMDDDINTLLLPCAHRVACVACARQLKGGRCPICREPIACIIRTFDG